MTDAFGTSRPVGHTEGFQFLNPGCNLNYEMRINPSCRLPP